MSKTITTCSKKVLRTETGLIRRLLLLDRPPRRNLRWSSVNLYSYVSVLTYQMRAQARPWLVPIRNHVSPPHNALGSPSTHLNVGGYDTYQSTSPFNSMPVGAGHKTKTRVKETCGGSDLLAGSDPKAKLTCDNCHIGHTFPTHQRGESAQCHRRFRFSRVVPTF